LETYYYQGQNARIISIEFFFSALLEQAQGSLVPLHDPKYFVT